MELREEIMAHLGDKRGEEWFYLYCYQTLQKIRDIVRDESLDDRECFAKIEEIVCLFEEIGSHGGGRRDFG